MAELSPAEASKQWNVSRTVLYEKMKKGELSFTLDGNGKRKIDTSELQRTFGSPRSSDESGEHDNSPEVSESVRPSESVDVNQLIDALKAQVNMLESQVNLLSNQLDSKDEQLSKRDYQVQSLINQISEMTKILPAPGSQQEPEDDYYEDEPEPKAKRRWWQFGRKVEEV